MKQTVQPTLIIHDAAQALAGITVAHKQNIDLAIQTAGDMAGALGPMWMHAFIDQCQNTKIKTTSPLVFHCGTSVGLTQAALSLGLPYIRLEPTENTKASTIAALKDIATQRKSTLWIGPPSEPCFRLPPPVGPAQPEDLEKVICLWLVNLSSEAKLP